LTKVQETLDIARWDIRKL